MTRLVAVLMFAVGCPSVDAGAAPDRFADHEAIVRDTHQASLAARERSLRDTVSRDAYWIKGAWGDTIWALAALYRNDKTDAANDRLLQYAQAYCQAREAETTDTAFRPGKRSDQSPWAYFALTDYVRILSLFRAGSPHHPSRLRPKTEAAMKEALWWLVKSKSKVSEASLDQILVHHGTENHDLTLRPNYYLVAGILKDDPSFADQRYDDGHTAAEHYAAYNAYFRAWPRQRAMAGLWCEMGSDAYQKYSWPALFNLHELSPGPLVRKRFGMLLDLAFVEEAQVSFRGRRGGGRSRAGYGKNYFEAYKNLLYAPAGMPARCSHSKVIETSSYQLPAAAILLRKLAFPAEAPFVIANRVPGEMEPEKMVMDKDDRRNAYVADSALLNYAYRTPHYLLGSTLQNPALTMPSPDTGEATLKYSGISRQNRWSGMLFCDPASRFPVVPALKHRADDELCAVYVEVEKTRGGRPQHPHWSFQHENVLLLQRIVPREHMGSYSTGPMSIRFHGKKLTKVEEGGWIFAGNGTAFVAVKFLDGGHKWDETGELASPSAHDRARSTTRVLIHGGDVDASGSFDAFRTAILATPLTVEPDRVEYQPTAAPRLTCFLYDAHAHTAFRLPQIDGEPLDLRPTWTYRSPYLNGRLGDDRFTVTVGPVTQVYDFGSED